IARCTWSPGANVPLSTALSPLSNSLRASASNPLQLVAMTVGGSVFALLNNHSPPTRAGIIANKAIRAVQFGFVLSLDIASYLCGCQAHARVGAGGAPIHILALGETDRTGAGA